MKGGNRGAETIVAYIITIESKSHPLVRSSWKCVREHCLSKNGRMHPLVTLSLTTYGLANLHERELKVTPRYTYDPTTLTSL